MHATDSINSSGFPLGFKTRQGAERPRAVADEPGTDVFRVEARTMAGHQKEAIVTEGTDGSAWRMVSDEGSNLKGTDLAPFPLAFFNAGLQADLINRIQHFARIRGIAIDSLETELDNAYAFSGSFYKGTGRGTAQPARIRLSVHSGAGAGQWERLVRDAVRASPALDAMRRPLPNTFALYVNGHRLPTTEMLGSGAPDALDPALVYSRPPAPLADTTGSANLIRKLSGPVSETELSPAAAASVDIQIPGTGRLGTPAGITWTETWLQRPAGSRFGFMTDERPDGTTGPSGLALASAGIAFCYMTQLARYIEYRKYRVRALRLVQFTRFGLSGNAAAGTLAGECDPVDTHLFFIADEPPEVLEKLLALGAHSCFLHAALRSALEPSVRVELNGVPLGHAVKSASELG